MARKNTLKPLCTAAGAVFTVSLLTPAAGQAAENPFGMAPLDGGYMQLAEGKCGEGKCGEGKCGGSKKGKGKHGMAYMDADGDGKVTREEFMKGHEAKFDKMDQNGDGVIDASERKARKKHKKGCVKEGKCGEGKCGEGKCGGAK